MIGMERNLKLLLNEFCDPRTGPDIRPPAKRSGSLQKKFRQSLHLVGRQPWGSPSDRFGFQGVGVFQILVEPLGDGGAIYSKDFGDLSLGNPLGNRQNRLEAYPFEFFWLSFGSHSRPPVSNRIKQSREKYNRWVSLCRTQYKNQIGLTTLLLIFMVSCPLLAEIATSPESENHEASNYQTISNQSFINSPIKVEEAIDSTAYLGKAVEWKGKIIFSDVKNGQTRFFVNSNRAINPESNMDFMFGVIFPKPLPNDERINIYSRLRVKGKIVGFEKLYNNKTSIFSNHRQPIVEASEATFISKMRDYDEPLVIRCY